MLRSRSILSILFDFYLYLGVPTFGVLTSGSRDSPCATGEIWLSMCVCTEALQYVTVLLRAAQHQDAFGKAPAAMRNTTHAEACSRPQLLFDLSFLRFL